MEGHKTLLAVDKCLALVAEFGIRHSVALDEVEWRDVKSVFLNVDAQGFFSELSVDHGKRRIHGELAPPFLGLFRSFFLFLFHFGRIEADSDRLTFDKGIAVDFVA